MDQTTQGQELPQISAQELARRHESIRFVGKYLVKAGRNTSGTLRYLETRPPEDGFWDIRSTEPANDLEPLATITTRHPVRWKTGMFDPTIGEYLSQIPEELVEQVAAVGYGSDNLLKDGDFHMISTHLYKYKTTPPPRAA